MAENRPSFFGDDRELTYRAAMLPIGTYRNKDGSESVGWAWPGMISEPYNAFQRLTEVTITEDGRLLVPNPQHPDVQRDVMTGLLSFYGGNALNPAARLPKNAIGSGLPVKAAENGRGAGLPRTMGDDAVDLIYDRIQKSDDEAFGLRVDRQGFALGDSFPASRRWDDGVPTDDILEGVSTVGIGNFGWPNSRDDVAAALKQTRPYTGDRVYLVGGKQRGYGEDPGELIMGQNNVLLSDTGKPSLFGSALAAENARPLDTVRMYHGTSGDAARAIQDGGFDPSYVPYLTPDRSKAATFGDHVVPVDVSKSALLVDFDLGDAGLLGVDDANRYLRSYDDLSIDDFIEKGHSFGVGGRNSIFDPRTGSTLYSDTGLPSLWGSALAAEQDPKRRPNFFDF